LVKYVEDKKTLPPTAGEVSPLYDPFNPQRRKTIPTGKIGGEQIPVVVSSLSVGAHWDRDSALIPDFIYTGKTVPVNLPENAGVITDFSIFSPEKNHYPLFSVKEKAAWKNCCEPMQFIRLSYTDLTEEIVTLLKEKTTTVIVLEAAHNHIYEQKAFIHHLMNRRIVNPVILRQFYDEPDLDSFRIKSATDCSSFFLDMQVDGIWLENQGNTFCSNQIDACSFGILQATGRRISKTEYISCPGCGRTLFDLQSTIKKVKAATNHLKGLKIGIMGCIVNGPGEMADADYGYVGAGPGKISLYKGKECIEKNIPAEKAVERLVNLIKKYGDWKEAEE
jgi:(E)-4-hydroxy-3-methylbut-2-enyl-diphosphate synthase